MAMKKKQLTDNLTEKRPVFGGRRARGLKRWIKRLLAKQARRVSHEQE
jgi:hypothetical protein